MFWKKVRFGLDLNKRIELETMASALPEPTVALPEPEPTVALPEPEPTVALPGPELEVVELPVAATAARKAKSVKYKDMNIKALTEAWDAATKPKDRDRLLTELQDRARTAKTDAERLAAWPSAAMAAREEMAGLYPDPADPRFAARLYEKREFYEARAVVAAVADGSVDPCTSTAAEGVFELTPVQRIVSRFLHPMTPYMGLLLFHGVGVGKTCSAVTIAEQFLETSPGTKVIVLVPQALKDNFKRTVFDPSKLVWNDRVGRWTTRQCTGTSYLERLDLLDNPDIRAVTYKAEEDRRNRYTVTGYQAFANWIDRTLKKSIPASLTGAARMAAENEVLRRLFSDHLIIVDEAHNLRDLAAEGTAAAGGETAAKGEAAENAGGKSLNPFLRRIVLNAEGLRLVLMTATPMYNSSQEILLLLNYLMMNDTKSEDTVIKMGDLFTRDGDLIPGSGQRLLERAARRYVSYMRGENPYTFPLRMKPVESPPEPAALWPIISATKKPVVLTEHETAALNALPLVFTEPVAGSPVEVQLRGATARGLTVAASAATAGPEEKQVDTMLDYRMQMANICYPNSMFGLGGWDFHFAEQTIPGVDHKLRIFSPKGFDVDTVFAGEGLRAHAPKIHRIIESIKSARGICFAYSRYIKAGALSLAAALERAGYQRKLANGQIAPLLTGVSYVPPVCAICGAADGAAHGPAGSTHPFRPACYVLLTSEEDYSPNFAGLVRQATTWDDPVLGPLGSNVKVVIGSQVASEGLDLKCIREMHILDSWYHLNRTDQIIGRAIRYCSHSALRAVEAAQGLPLMALSNCLIYMHVTLVPETEAGPALETADMYAYRISIGKALMVGKVQRLLKKHAWDCNLELEAITFAGLPPRLQIDAQGHDRRSEGKEGYDINDRDYTTYCDYQVCRNECAITIEEEGLHLDTSTFSVSDARRIVIAKQSIVRTLFDDQVIIPETIIQDIFSDLPWEIASEALMELLDGRHFRLTRPDGVEGFLVKKAGYLVFQPLAIADTEIPMTMRYARSFQLKRRIMEPVLPVWGRARAEERGARPALAASAAAAAVSSVSSVAAAAAAAAAPAPILGKWAEWLAFVDSGGAAKLPSYLSSTLRIWSWLLQQYKAVPELRVVALRWWFEKEPTFDEQRFLLEYATGIEDPADPLRLALDRDIFRNASLRAYRVFNPLTTMVDIYRWNKEGAIVLCDPLGDLFRPTIDKALGNVPVALGTGTGSIFGFLAPKKGRIVFKTLDTTKPKTHSSIGAECGNTSNLGEHHPRIRMLHEAGRGSELAPYMLADSDAGWDEDGAKKRMSSMAPTHMKDITHQPLCMYMEFLTRILDARHIGNRRWYLNAIEAIQSGLKGKKA